MTAGRPSEYKEEYIAKVDEYLEQCHITMDEFHKTRGEKSDSYERIALVNIPKIEGFCEFIDVGKPNLLGWERKHPKFRNATNKIRRKQHNMLVDGGLDGTLNTGITRLLLSSNHGYREKSDTDITSNGKTIQANIIEFTNGKSQSESK